MKYNERHFFLLKSVYLFFIFFIVDFYVLANHATIIIVKNAVEDHCSNCKPIKYYFELGCTFYVAWWSKKIQNKCFQSLESVRSVSAVSVSREKQPKLAGT
jgi:hypothetical protein